MSLFRRKIGILLILVLITGVFSACSKKTEYGTIDNVEISVPEENEDEINIFKKYDSPADYSYTKASLVKGNLQFDVPDIWRVNAENSRCLSIQTPDEDPYLPATTVYLLSSYWNDVDDNELSESTHNNNSMYFSAIFKEEIAGLRFRVHGRLGHLRRYVGEDAIHNGLEFAGGQNSKEATTLEMNDVTIMTDSAKYYTNEYGMVATYVRWDHSPYCFVSVVPKKYMKRTRKMIEYMASSINYLPYPSEGCKKAAYEDFSMLLPVSFKPVEDIGNIFISDMNENTATAGMSVSIYRTDSKSSRNIAADTIKDYICPKMIPVAYGMYGGSRTYGYDISANADPSPDFSGRIFISPSYSSSSEIAASVFGRYDMLKMDNFLKEVDGNTYIISVTYHERQRNLAEAIEEEILRSFKITEK